jgi:autotransporter translocation and assembly factor TamB
MKRITLGALACAAAVSLPAVALPADNGSPWIHVRVEEAQKRSKVSVNLPLSVAEAALAAAPSHVIAKGKLNLGCHNHGVSIASLRQAWAELKKTGDAELVSVEDEDETVNVSRQGDRVHVKVSSPGKGEKVSIEVPVAAVDALFAGEGDDLDLQGALAEIRKVKGDIVQVDDGDSKVHIWIDGGI